MMVHLETNPHHLQNSTLKKSKDTKEGLDVMFKEMEDDVNYNSLKENLKRPKGMKGLKIGSKGASDD